MKSVIALFLSVMMLMLGTAASAEQLAKVDFDLTQMNQVMSFATLSSMVDMPAAYTGKTFRLRGFYQSFRTNDPEHVWLVLSEADRKACCYNDGEVLLTCCFDIDQAFELPEEEQLFEITGMMGKTKRIDRDVWALQISELIPMEGTLADVYWP